MNTKTSKGAAALLLAGIASAWPALAEAIKIRGSLKDSKTATDTFELYCPSTTNKAKARVWDIRPAAEPRMRVVLVGSTWGGWELKCKRSCPHIKIDNRTDADGEGGKSSRRAKLAAGAGKYTVIIDKNAIGVETYKVEATCYTQDNKLIKSLVTLKKCQDEEPGRGHRC